MGADPEIRIGTVAHAERGFDLAIAGSSLTLVRKDDIVGDEDLASARSEWNKYLNRPMLQIWQLRG